MISFPPDWWMEKHGRTVAQRNTERTSVNHHRHLRSRLAEPKTPRRLRGLALRKSKRA